MRRVLVVAKAPVPGRVKTRLAATVGPRAAAEVAAASLLDTLETAATVVGAEACHLSLAGDLGGAVRGAELAATLASWTVTPQRGEGLGPRLVAAHEDAGPGPVAQVGMDTPQVTPGDLDEVFRQLEQRGAVLGPAVDGGWWVLARRDPRAVRGLAAVVMSEPTTYADTRAALASAGLDVGTAPLRRDVDTAEDAEHVAGEAPDRRFAAVWAACRTAAR